MNDWEKLYDSVNKRQLGFVRHKNWGVGVVTKGAEYGVRPHL
jgi:hypothetical protein